MKNRMKAAELFYYDVRKLRNELSIRKANDELSARYEVCIRFICQIFLRAFCCSSACVCLIESSADLVPKLMDQMSDCVIGFVDWVYVSKMAKSRNGNEIDKQCQFRSFFIFFSIESRNDGKKWISDNNKRCVCHGRTLYLFSSSIFFSFPYL